MDTCVVIVCACLKYRKEFRAWDFYLIATLVYRHISAMTIPAVALSWRWLHTTPPPLTVDAVFALTTDGAWPMCRC